MLSVLRGSYMGLKFFETLCKDMKYDHSKNGLFMGFLTHCEKW